MQHLFQSWRAFSDDCRTVSHVLLLSDYDGTLTPIVGHPDDAVLSPEVRNQLSALAQRPAFSVGIISGREISELKSLVAIEGIYYAGNHGLEIEGPGLSYVSPEAGTARATMHELAGRLAAVLANIPGVIIQDKGLSLSVHYRLVKPGQEGAVAEAVQQITGPLSREGRIKVFTGKKVWEVRPPIDWHKGKAVEAISREIKSLLEPGRIITLYLGDDNTDEDAFRVVRRPEGWSIFVGQANTASHADYYLTSTAEVAEFLARLIQLK